MHNWKVEINAAGFIGTRSLQPSVLVRELGKWSVTYMCGVISGWARLISLTLIWWQGLCMPPQWHEVWNPLTYSTFNRGFLHLSAEPDFQNPSKMCFMISPGCRFSSDSIRISETAVEGFTGGTKIWSDIIVLLKENKKKIISLV